MKRLIAAIALGAIVATTSPAEAQTLTYGSKSVHSATALQQRARARQHNKRLEKSRIQRSAAARARSRQVRALRLSERRVKQRPRYSVKSTQTPTYVQKRIDRNATRVHTRRVPGQIKPGVRIVQRRLATDEEMRGFRGRPTPHQRAARAGRIVN